MLLSIGMKIAQAIPISKEGDIENAHNNRSVSLLPLLSKICEKTVHNQLHSYLHVDGRLSKLQSGNIKWYSTETSGN